MRRYNQQTGGFGRVLVVALVALCVLASPWGARVSVADDHDDEEKLYGVVQALPATPGYVGDWVVSGKTVHVSSATRIEQEHGSVALGASVEVEGSYRADGSMDAWKIEVKSSGSGGGSGSAKYYGVIEALPTGGFVGDWTVSGKVVHVSGVTQIEQEHGLVALGASVEVEGSYRADGSMDAWKIEVKSSGSGGGSGSAKYYGVIEALPTGGFVGDWTVSGKLVHVLATTSIREEYAPVALGAYVEVEGVNESDGSLTAWKIEVKSSSSGGGTGTAATWYAVLRLTPAAPAFAALEGKVVLKQFFVDGAVVREDFKVSLEHALPHTVYDVFVDAIHAGALLTNDEGEGRLFLSSGALAEAEPLPAGLSPLNQRQTVEVKVGQELILSGNLANAVLGGSDLPQPSRVSTAALTNPQGQVVGAAIIKTKASKQELKLVGFGLPIGIPVQVFIDGLLLGNAATDSQGRLEATFSSRPDDDDILIPEAMLPVASWTQVELKDNQGNVLGAGQFAAPVTLSNETGPGSARRYLGRGRG